MADSKPCIYVSGHPEDGKGFRGHCCSWSWFTVNFDNKSSQTNPIGRFTNPVLGTDYAISIWSGVADSILLHLAGHNRSASSYNGNSDDLSPIQHLSGWPAEDRASAAAFALVNTCFYDAYQRRFNEAYMKKKSPIRGMPTEVLETILHHFKPASWQLAPLWERASLSVESFGTMQPLPTEDAHMIRQFRLVCQSFAAFGLRSQFLRVQIRFSLHDFEKLRQIAQRSHLACHVQQFSYMVPCIYSQDKDQFDDILQKFDQALHTHSSTGSIHTARHLREARRADYYRDQVIKAMAKADEQGRIRRAEIDIKTLTKALKSFKNLRQIRVMRVVDEVDKGWTAFLRNNPDYAVGDERSRWTSSSDAAVATLYGAIQKSECVFERLSSRFMDPSIPPMLTRDLEKRLQKTASGLKTFEVQIINDDPDPNEKIRQMSEAFRVLFRDAASLQSFHIGFSHQVSLPLASIFHKKRFDNLWHIGLHLWEVDWEELAQMLEHHQRTLKSLRLRSVLLRTTRTETSDLAEDSANLNWQKVLGLVRSRLTLKWISLRNVGYEGGNAQSFGLQPLPHHGFMPEDDSESDLDDEADAWSESNPESDEESIDAGNDISAHGAASAQDIMSTSGASFGHDTEDDDTMSEGYDARSIISADDLDDEGSPNSDRNESYQHPAPCRPVAHCSCAQPGLAWNDLVDNGVTVDRAQWKMWQRWAMKPCSRHDPPVPRIS